MGQAEGTRGNPSRVTQLDSLPEFLIQVAEKTSPPAPAPPPGPVGRSPNPARSPTLLPWRGLHSRAAQGCILQALLPALPPIGSSSGSSGAILVLGAGLGVTPWGSPGRLAGRGRRPTRQAGLGVREGGGKGCQPGGGGQNGEGGASSPAGLDGWVWGPGGAQRWAHERPTGPLSLPSDREQRE